MLSPTLLKAYNEQIAHELQNSHLYFVIRAWFCNRSLDGFAAFFNKQAIGERDHADKLMAYVQEHKDIIQIAGIEKVPANFKTPLDVLKLTLATEQKTTTMLKALYTLATKENDFASQAMLDWFMIEQVEEETVTQKIIDHLEGVAGAYAGLLIIDENLKD